MRAIYAVYARVNTNAADELQDRYQMSGALRATRAYPPYLSSQPDACVCLLLARCRDGAVHTLCFSRRVAGVPR